MIEKLLPDLLTLSTTFKDLSVSCNLASKAKISQFGASGNRGVNINGICLYLFRFAWVNFWNFFINCCYKYNNIMLSIILSVKEIWEMASFLWFEWERRPWRGRVRFGVDDVLQQVHKSKIKFERNFVRQLRTLHWYYNYYHHHNNNYNSKGSVETINMNYNFNLEYNNKTFSLVNETNRL